ncbi:hypothetical protein VPH35_054722 [Triticum aestivum]|uniref:Aminoglycoside phosphotransferase domain-containing protein n=1 Tax=Triticum aestivum TaxID=4565 RepID=A0A077S353_WHEAT|nr:unnamed protein product [Triticum aestivum]
MHAAQALDEAALLQYAAAHVPGFPSSSTSLALMQFGHGQSNPTYCIEASAPGGEARCYVLRKKPVGAILQSFSLPSARPPPAGRFHRGHGPAPPAGTKLAGCPFLPSTPRILDPSSVKSSIQAKSKDQSEKVWTENRKPPAK